MTEESAKKEKKTILIVEDDESSFLLLKIFLAPGNYNLLYAKNGLEGLELFQENPDIDLILMDLKMPVVDGYAATREIRAANSQIPIIAQTAFALSDDCEKAIGAGCTDYISKPICKEVLLQKIEYFLK